MFEKELHLGPWSQYISSKTSSSNLDHQPLIDVVEFPIVAVYIVVFQVVENHLDEFLFELYAVGNQVDENLVVGFVTIGFRFVKLHEFVIVFVAFDFLD